MNGIAIVSTRESPTVKCALIRSRTFDALLREARHVGYQNAGEVVEVWKLGDRPARRVYVEYRRKYDREQRREKFCEVIRVSGIAKGELPKIEGKEGWTR